MKHVSSPVLGPFRATEFTPDWDLDSGVLTDHMHVMRGGGCKKYVIILPQKYWAVWVAMRHIHL